MATPSPTRGSGFWFIIIAVAIILLGGIWWLSASDQTADGEGRDLEPAVSEPLDDTVAPGNPEPTTSEPTPLPGSPAATGTAGQPSGTTGASPQPGDPTEAAGTN